MTNHRPPHLSYTRPRRQCLRLAILGNAPLTKRCWCLPPRRSRCGCPNTSCCSRPSRPGLGFQSDFRKNNPYPRIARRSTQNSRRPRYTLPESGPTERLGDSSGLGSCHNHPRSRTANHRCARCHSSACPCSSLDSSPWELEAQVELAAGARN